MGFRYTTAPQSLPLRGRCQRKALTEGENKTLKFSPPVTSGDSPLSEGALRISSILKILINGRQQLLLGLGHGDALCLSARSLGEVNVQVILEALGGGGNSTTAGGQAENITVEEAKAKLLEAIDKYFEN